MITPTRNLWLSGLVLLIGMGSLDRIQANSDCSEFTPFGRPAAQGADAGEPSNWTIICHTGQVVAFNPDRNVSDWVAFRLRKEQLVNPVVQRKDRFRGDPEVPAQHRVVPDDYTKTGYDRGHLAPAASMKWSKDAMDDSFLMTNISPQVGVGFNQHIWKRLERKMREWACDRSDLYIVTGPLYESQETKRLVYDSDGDGVDDNDITVSVPSHFFKLAFDEVAKDAIAFVLPNMKLKTSDLPKYIVPGTKHVSH